MLTRAVLVVAALGGLVACGQQVIQPPHGPQASAAPDRATAVINRTCARTPRSDIQALDVTFMHSSLLRQEAQLQRVSDDLTGAVPAGNIPTDTQLADANGRQLVDLVGQSTLCSPFKEKLVAASRELAAADDELAQSAGGGDVAGALQTAQDKFQALKDITQNPPSP